MTPVVAVIAPGMMGAAVGKRLADNGVKVLTSLQGRSAETATRAKAAGMAAAGDEEIAACDFILSILPPGDAVALAERFQPALKASNAKPVYVDCNAINPKTVDRVAAVIAPTDCPFVDSGIGHFQRGSGAHGAIQHADVETVLAKRGKARRGRAGSVKTRAGVAWLGRRADDA